nr:RNA-directed DNA polymerase, eukaryota, reverse transcriptase zinc-binding domain protein [Tanacetum cinerariifolium]
MVFDELLPKRIDLSRKLHDLKQMELKDATPKAKVNWAIEGDENSKFFHGVINKRHDAVFIGEWSIENLDNLLKILNCFRLASRLCINVNKSHVLGVGVPLDIICQGALRIGCKVMQTPFKYLEVMVGDHMSHYSAWSNTIQKVCGRLSRWKVKTLSIGGRLTLLKSILGAVPIYNMIEKLHRLRGRRCYRLRKMRVLEYLVFLPSTGLFFSNGYGDTSFKMVLCGITSSVLFTVLGWSVTLAILSPWGVILLEVHQLASKGFNCHSNCKIRVGDGLNTRFWFDTWILDLPLNVWFPRLFALELDKDISVDVKWSAPSFDASFRRQVRDGVERNQWSALLYMLGMITLSSSSDRYFCDLNSDGAYRVKDIRSKLDDLFLPSSAVATRWVNLVPIKVNIFTWRVSLDRLLTREFIVGETFNGRSSRLSLIGLLGSVLFIFHRSLKSCWRVFSTLLDGMSGPFGLGLFLTLLLQEDL